MGGGCIGTSVIVPACFSGTRSLRYLQLSPFMQCNLIYPAETPPFNLVTSVNYVYMLVYYACKPHLTHGTLCPCMRLYMHSSYVVRFWASKRPGGHQRATPALIASGYAQRAVYWLVQPVAASAYVSSASWCLVPAATVTSALLAGGYTVGDLSAGTASGCVSLH